MTVNVSEEHTASIFSSCLEIQVVYASGTVSTYQIVWHCCRRTQFHCCLDWNWSHEIVVDSVQNKSFGVYPILHPTATGCYLAFNTTLILYILPFLTCVTFCFGQILVNILIIIRTGTEIIIPNVYFVLSEGLRFIPFPIWYPIHTIIFIKIACTPHKLLFWGAELFMYSGCRNKVNYTNSTHTQK